jgi:hypothetical protein
MITTTLTALGTSTTGFANRNHEGKVFKLKNDMNEINEGLR